MNTVIVTPNRNRIALIMAIHGLRAVIRSNGKMILASHYTPKNLRSVATRLTGNEYKRSMQGNKDALADLEKMKAELES